MEGMIEHIYTGWVLWASTTEPEPIVQLSHLTTVHHDDWMCWRIQLGPQDGSALTTLSLYHKASQLSVKDMRLSHEATLSLGPPRPVDLPSPFHVSGSFPEAFALTLTSDRSFLTFHPRMLTDLMETSEPTCVTVQLR